MPWLGFPQLTVVAPSRRLERHLDGVCNGALIAHQGPMDAALAAYQQRMDAAPAAYQRRMDTAPAAYQQRMDATPASHGRRTSDASPAAPSAALAPAHDALMMLKGRCKRHLNATGETP
uniref:Uncharacterized protein n=1 Tax=Vitis vinifera TaxID=29760 RepID=A5BP58_VITVI|nr:hypothetical protein VITISV_016017 [Vitis vinifera]